MFRQFSSGKRKPYKFFARNSTKATGTVNMRVRAIPEETAPCLAAMLPDALCLAIMRDTVMGMPLDVAVRNTAKTERQIW